MNSCFWRVNLIQQTIINYCFIWNRDKRWTQILGNNNAKNQWALNISIHQESYISWQTIRIHSTKAPKVGYQHLPKKKSPSTTQCDRSIAIIYGCIILLQCFQDDPYRRRSHHHFYPFVLWYAYNIPKTFVYMYTTVPK